MYANLHESAFTLGLLASSPFNTLRILASIRHQLEMYATKQLYFGLRTHQQINSANRVMFHAPLKNEFLPFHQLSTKLGAIKDVA